MRSGNSSLCYMMAVLLIACNLLCRQSKLTAQEARPMTKLVAPTPPMGWNSWDSYGLRINEQQFRESVQAMATKLKPFGYTYAVIDEGWYMVNPADRPTPDLLKYAVDENGRFIPVTGRFPSALQNGRNAGFQELAKSVHAKGLKFGVHIIRGIPRESVLRNLPIEGSAFKVRMLRTRMTPVFGTPQARESRTPLPARRGRLSPSSIRNLGCRFPEGGLHCGSSLQSQRNSADQAGDRAQRSRHCTEPVTRAHPLEHHSEVGDLAQMWRISNDIWDIWIGNSDFPIGIKNQFDNAARWAQYTKPGNWPDADMLPVGELRPYPDVGPGPRHTRLTPAEQQTQLSLWAMARSPLIIGANLNLLDQNTLLLLCNADVLKIDQAATASRQVLREGDLVIWTADLPGDQHALAAFNLGEKVLTFDRALSDFVSAGHYDMKNAWTGERLPAGARISITLEPHASVVLMLDKR